MKLFYSIKLVILSIMMCCPELVMAQAARPLTRQEIDAVLNPSLLEGAEKIVQFEETVVNIGEMTEDDNPVETNFYFKNISAQPVVITRLHTDCGCTAAKIDKLNVQPGEKACISVTYTPENHPERLMPTHLFMLRFLIKNRWRNWFFLAMYCLAKTNGTVIRMLWEN